MPTLSAAALKARINTLQKQLAAAENKKTPAIKKVTALMKKLGVTVADLQSPTPAGRGRRGRPPGKANGKGNGGARSSKRAGSKVAIKYRDDQGNTWTGRGKTPRWLVAAEKSGKHRDQFKVQ